MIYWIFLASGLFALVNAGPRWAEFKESEAAGMLAGKLGELGARAIYLVVGTFLVGLAAHGLLFAA